MITVSTLNAVSVGSILTFALIVYVPSHSPTPTISDGFAVDINVVILLGKNFTSTSKAPKRVCTPRSSTFENTKLL